MADFKSWELEIGMELVCWSFAEQNNFSKGSSESKKNAKWFEFGGQQPHLFLNSELCFPLNSIHPKLDTIQWNLYNADTWGLARSVLIIGGVLISQGCLSCR